ncbi:DMT family transporter [Dankookia rubra]
MDKAGCRIMPSHIVAYSALGVAIACELVGTTFLQKSQQFTRLWPSLAVAVFYVAAFYFLTHALRVMPLGVAYAIWSGVGIVMTAAIGVVVFKQTLDLPALVGIAMIVGGVVIMQAFSAATEH